MNTTRVLVLVDYYLPGWKYGGPIRTIANMVEQLGDAVSFRIVTRDRDLGDTQPFPNHPPGMWHQMGQGHVRYLAPEECTFRSLRRVLGQAEYDVIYLNSLFSPVFTIVPLLLLRLGLIERRPVIVAPRGNLAPGGLRLKRGKKLAYILAAKALGLYRGVTWQASSELEERDTRKWFGRAARVHVAPDLRESLLFGDAQEPAEVKRSGRLKIAFLSRVCRMKNLDGALAMLEGLRGEVELHVYGPLEDRAYLQECRRRIDRLPANVTVEIHGPVPYEQVAAVMRQQQIMLLPTHGENFGHVILESLLAGCPVVISDRTPWRGLAERGVGWDLPLERPDEFRRVLQRFIDMDESEYRPMSSRAREYGLSVAADRDAVERNRGLFEIAAAAGRRAA